MEQAKAAPTKGSRRYDFAQVEAKWQAIWEREGRWHGEDLRGTKRYILSMFPYPSGHCHMGHVRNYSISDVVSRIARKRGFNVMHPMGYDSFGLPAEQAAIDRGVDPAKFIDQCITSFEADLKRLGFSFDWQRAYRTSDPDYYRWTQWLFLLLWRRGLVYRKRSAVNWCEEHGVLANEEAAGGVCWRCNRPVEKRELEQWFIRTTAYADRLLEDLKLLEGKWPERVITMQRNWIGRSEGAYVDFEVPYLNTTLRVFTTRPDTLWGVTFMAVAPEHPIVGKVAELNPDRAGEILAYVERAKTKTEEERTAEEREKTGLELGISALHPTTGEDVPIYVADYVLMEYGTGAVMGVPAHDLRDYEFAQKYGLPIVEVIEPPAGEEYETPIYVGYGRMVNSGPLTGTEGPEAVRKTAEYLESIGKGEPAVTYRLRDWLLSRQRYWGCPIPLVHCEQCGWVPVPEEELPVLLPEGAPIASAKGSPLAEVEEFVRTTCPQCGGSGRRETDTMTTFMDSAWYFLRFCDPRNSKQAFDPKKVAYWMPVDIYVGGIEHAVGHLMYARFINKVLHDEGLVPYSEPFTVLFTQGMLTYPAYYNQELGWVPEKEVDTERLIHRETGRPVERIVLKMSKSKFNTVSPQEMIERYGADTVRLFSLFGGPPDQDFEWQEGGVSGCHRFLSRLWRLCHEFAERFPRTTPSSPKEPSQDGLPAELERERHHTLAAVNRDVAEGWSFNTAIARLMELLNFLNQQFPKLSGEDQEAAPAFAACLRSELALLSPFCPHIAEELWEVLGFEGRAEDYPWEEPDPAWLARETVTIPVTIRGKVRAEVEVPAEAGEEEVRQIVLSHERVKNYLEGKEVVKFIYVPGRIVNIVLK